MPPITESDTIHAAQAELERLLESDDMRYLRIETRLALRLMAIQMHRFTRMYDQVQDLQGRLDAMKGSGAGEDID